MRVIVVNDHLYPDGGADVVALSAAEGCARFGMDVTLFVGDALRPDDQTRRRARLVTLDQHDLLRNPRPVQAALQGLWNVTAARALRKLLDAHDPRDTVVHLHSWTKSLSSSVVKVAHDAGFPLVCTLHDYFTGCPNGTLYNFVEGRVCHRPPMSASCLLTDCDARSYAHKLYRVARQGIQTQWGGLPGRFRHVIAVSRFSERILKPWMPEDVTVHHVRNPIEVAQGPAADVTQSNGFVLVARLFPPKNQEQFLEACERIGVRGTCVGDGPELQALKDRYPTGRFTGPLGRADVAREMAAARALVMPSRWYETQGLVCAEAAALGVPSVVYDGCAAVDFVTHEQTGLVVRSGHVDELALALQRLHLDPGLAARLGSNARAEFWADPPTPHAHAQDLMKVYESMLAGHHARCETERSVTA